MEGNSTQAHMTAKLERPENESRQTATAHATECEHDMDGRGLVVDIDGSSNQFGKKNTNVIELYHLLRKEQDDKQQTWYNSGIGTYAQPSWKSLNYLKQVLYHKVDLAIAWDFEKTVLAAYRWLSDNYQPGDKIFLFGFSRGAFQVRVLSAMIHKVGLIHKGNESQIPFAYELYADHKSDVKTVDNPRSGRTVSMADRFKETFSRKDVKVHFVGAWDTVSSIGIVRDKRQLPHTVDGMTHVCYFRHALALDERRVKFLPEFAYGGRAVHPESQNGSTSEGSEMTQKRPQVKEVWFAGTHSDIGGGNVHNVGMDRSRPPLRWMVLEAEAVGLRTTGFPSELSPKDFIELRESLTWPWWPLEFLPLKRLTFSRDKEENAMTRKPHFGQSRKIHPGQKIHASVLLGTPEKPYTPKARPPNDDSGFWAELNKNINNWVELDLDEFVRITVDRFVNSGEPTDLQQVKKIGKAAVVSQTLYDKLVEVLQKVEGHSDEKYQLLKFTVNFLSSDTLRPQLKLEKSTTLRVFLRDMPTDGAHDDGRLIQAFIRTFTNRHVTTLEGHTRPVSSVAFSPDGRYLASGSYDNTIRLWDAQTWQAVGQPFRGHNGPILSIAFSPDSKHIVAGSSDDILRVWEVETGKAAGKPLEGHTESVWSVAYSPDGRLIASGSWDGTVRLWDAEKGEAVGKPLEGHGDWVRSVTFSPDGKVLASGSADRTIRLWSVETGEPAGDPFRGHTGLIFSIAFSPDEKHIISGSDDETLRLWDVQTGKEDGRPFQGHTDRVLSVGFSPDGRRVVSGSRDGTVRLWNISTREMEGLPLTGHTDWVWSVAFSPDGSRVASGSNDETIRIWDVED